MFYIEFLEFNNKVIKFFFAIKSILNNLFLNFKSKLNSILSNISNQIQKIDRIIFKPTKPNKNYQWFNRFNFQLFPNPSSDAVNMLLDMSTKQDVSYVITDITGKQVYADKLTNISSDIYPINTTHLVSGLYFVTCKFDGGKQLTQKLIINK